MITHQNKHLTYGLGQKAAFEIDNADDKHSEVKRKDAETKDFAFWGKANRYPHDFLAKVRKTGAAGSSYNFIANAMYGQGIKLIEHTQDENGKELKRIVPLNEEPDIKDFFKKIKLERFYVETIFDLSLFNIAFPEVILTNNYEQIASVRRLSTPKCRFQVMDDKTGLINNIYYSHEWEQNTNVKDDSVKKIPVVDSYATAEQVKQYCKQNRIKKFVYPIFFPLTDEIYYPEPFHHAPYHNGWMDVVNNIPEYKKAYSKNQLNIKYLVKISEEYFRKTYEDDWQKYKPEEKKKIREELAKDIDEYLSGNKNAGKSIQVTRFLDKEGNYVDGIQVEPIKDDTKSDGTGILDSSAGNSEIMSAIGTDPNLMGVGIPGGKLNSSSGSDKREAMSILNSLMKPKRDIALQVFDLIRDYNGWNPDLQGRFAVENLTTLDANPTGTQEEV